MNTKDIIDRIALVRHRANLSARELSRRLGKNDGYINGLESRKGLPSLDALLEIIEICGMTCEQFFYENINDYEKDKQLLTIFNTLKSDKKQQLIDFLSK